MGPVFENVEALPSNIEVKNNYKNKLYILIDHKR